MPRKSFPVVGRSSRATTAVMRPIRTPQALSSWLVQHESYGFSKCMLTFAGTDSMADAFQDLQVFPAHFCGFLDPKDENGLQNGHTFTFWGFKEQLLRMVSSVQFHENIRPELSKCDTVSAVGHSLKGAMATLFSMCVNKAHKKEEYGYEDYALMGFRRDFE